MSCGFECGRLYAILGPSGAGKTTLLSLLAGLDTPVQGEIRYDGIPVTPKDLARHRRSHISLVFQSYNLIDYLTPLENVRLGGGGDPKMLLSSVGIREEYWNRGVLQLSGGQPSNCFLLINRFAPFQRTKGQSSLFDSSFIFDVPMPEYSEASSTVRFIFFQIGTLGILDLSCLSDIRCNLLPLVITAYSKVCGTPIMRIGSSQT